MELVHDRNSSFHTAPISCSISAESVITRFLPWYNRDSSSVIGQFIVLGSPLPESDCEKGLYIDGDRSGIVGSKVFSGSAPSFQDLKVFVKMGIPAVLDEILHTHVR